MDKIQQHLNIVFKVSINSQNYFVNKNQNDLIRFVFCGIQKVQKISRTFLLLYPNVCETFEELEFSMGILSRSLLMDMILVMKLKHTISTHNGDFDDLKKQVKLFCYSVVFDGAKNIVNQIKSDKLIPTEKREEFYKRIDNEFPNAFDFSNDKPKSKTEIEINLSSFCKECQGTDLSEKSTICFLYSYYSKYDHLSHLTSKLPTEISFDERKEMLDRTILLMTLHLRDLLSIAFDFEEEYKILEPYINEIKKHLQEHYSQKGDE